MRVRKQAVFFTDLSMFPASSQMAVDLLQKFQVAGLNLLPNVIQDQGFMLPNGNRVERLQFKNADRGLSITFGMNRLDILSERAGVEGAEPQDFPIFVEVVGRIMAAIFTDRAVRANRLAYVVQDFNAEYAPPKMEKIGRALLNLPTFYASLPPKEWTFRLNSESEIRFGEKAELANCITKVERGSTGILNLATGSMRTYDAVVSEYDFNTLVENATPRFEYGEMSTFVSSADASVNTISSALEGLAADQ